VDEVRVVVAEAGDGHDARAQHGAILGRSSW
jgi:hypothetical protein